MRSALAFSLGTKVVVVPSLVPRRRVRHPHGHVAQSLAGRLGEWALGCSAYTWGPRTLPQPTGLPLRRNSLALEADALDRNNAIPDVRDSPASYSTLVGVLGLRPWSH